MTCRQGHDAWVSRPTGARYCRECQRDYGQRRRAAKAAGLDLRPRTTEERFWSKVESGELHECWTWTACVDRKGYGKFHAGGSVTNLVMAHRWAYEHLVDNIPAGLQLDHLCRNPSCVNPWHCEPVTPEENARRTRGIPQPNKKGRRKAA